MSEGLLRTAKHTLCELILALGTMVTCGSCTSVPTQQVPQAQVEQNVEDVVKQAIKYFTNKEYAKAEGLIEQRLSYITQEYSKQLTFLQKQNPAANLPFPELSPSERALFALSYAMNNKYNQAETQFTALLEYFKKNPESTIEDIDKNLDEFFMTDQYKLAEKRAIAATNFYPKMHAVVGFLALARKDYSQARRFFKYAIPNFDENVVQQYRDAFEKLLVNACSKKDEETAIEYTRLLHSVYSVKGKQEEVKK